MHAPGGEAYFVLDMERRSARLRRRLGRLAVHEAGEGSLRRETDRHWRRWSADQITGVMFERHRLPPSIAVAGNGEETSGRDGVFDVPEQLIRNGPQDPMVEIALSNDAQVKATGNVAQKLPLRHKCYR
jgi:hypothetical protein